MGQQFLPLNERCYGREQNVTIEVVLPDYNTIGMAHLVIQLETRLDAHDQVQIALSVRGANRAELTLRPAAFTDVNHGKVGWTITGPMLGLTKEV